MRVTVDLPPKLVPLFLGEADVRCSFGGRGSAKTRSFAKMSAVRALQWDAAGASGIILCGRQWQNSLADSSFEEVKHAIASEPWLAAAFDVGETYIRTKSGRVSYSFVGLSRNVSSIKSKARILLAWIDEAEDVPDTTWGVLLPTVREEGSEVWVTYNPASERAAVHTRFRLSTDPLIRSVEMNWRDNPWFPETLDRQRLRDKAERPDTYGHIWEGEFLTAAEGAYYARQLREAREDGRIGVVRADPMFAYHVFCDIGGTGMRADAFAMWVCQIVQGEIRWVDYYEAVGQPLASHANWLRERGYAPGRAQIWLPHDGGTHDKVYAVSPESALRQAGWSVQVVPNQGRGAARQRIEATRRWFGRMRFDEERCAAGLKALAWYHPKIDAERGTDLGPEHDWSSHACDAIGIAGIVYRDKIETATTLDYSRVRKGIV